MSIESSTNNSTQSLLSAASVAAQSAATTNSSTSSSATASSTSNAALSSLGSNYNEFLTLLTTQLQHQDPSDPMSTDSFTSELAQFAGVEQQVQTNNNLSTLISATQDNQLTSSLAMVGKNASVNSSQLPLQNGTASTSFNVSSTDPVAIAVTNASGAVVKTATLTPSDGSNTWSWNGVSDLGQKLSDGQYNIGIVQENSDGTTTTLIPDISGTITAVSKSSSGVQVQMGNVTTSLDNVSDIF